MSLRQVLLVLYSFLCREWNGVPHRPSLHGHHKHPLGNGTGYPPGNPGSVHVRFGHVLHP